MTQTIAVDVPLGPARTGLAIGAIVYQLDGTTVYSTFDVAGWYEKPLGTGDWHHPGVVGPDAGGVIAVGIAGTEYKRQAFPSALNFATPTNVSDAQTALSALINAVQSDTNDIQAQIGVAGAGLTSITLSTLTMQAIADELLKRSVSHVEGTAGLTSLAELLLAIFESDAPNSTWTIYRTDHSTVFNTRSLVEDSAALPVTGVN